MMRSDLQTLAAIVVGLALVVALPGPCNCGSLPSPVHADEHACCAPPAGVRAEDHGCCDEDAVVEGVLTPSPGVAAVSSVAAIVVQVDRTPELRSVPVHPLADSPPAPPTVLRL